MEFDKKHTIFYVRKKYINTLEYCFTFFLRITRRLFRLGSTFLTQNLGLVFIAVFLSFGGSVNAAEPTVEIYADKNEISIGESVKIIVLMKWQQIEENNVEIIKITAPYCSLLNLVGSSQSTASQLMEDGVYAKRITEYYFEGKEKGGGIIESAVIEYSRSGNSEDRNIIKSEIVSIKVVPYVKSFLKKLLSGVFYILMTLLSIIAIISVKRLIKGRVGKKTKEVIDTRMEVELLESMKILNKHLIEGDYKKYYAEAIKVLEQYINQKYKINSLDNHDNKIAGEIPDKLYNLYLEWLDMADKVRFSGYKPEKHKQEKLIRELEKHIKVLIPVDDPEGIIEIIDGKESENM